MRVNHWTGTVECSDCRMDLGNTPSGYAIGLDDDVYCGHCQNEAHVCRVPEAAAKFIIRAYEWNAGETRSELVALELLEEMASFAQREEMVL
ncbi:hypothetical protein [Streptomyces sp. NPDC048057]|uniref:hypothetical protein n=1 Tax=Streptomyces sp. NPDC048057 TaxID=3155628 RepID=UPI0033CBE2AB